MNQSDADRWLYVGAFVPMAQARHAGGRVAFENLRGLRRQHAAVDVVICTTEPVAAAPAPPGVKVFRQRGRDLAAYLLSASGSLGWRRLLTAPVLHTRLQSACQGELVMQMQAHRYAGLFADFTQSALLVQRAAAAAGCSAPLTLCVHDVFAQRLLRSSRRLERWLTGAVLRDEHALLSSVQCVLTLSEKDRRLAQTLYTLARVESKPYDPPEWCSRVKRDAVAPDGLLFFANFERNENSGGARWFVREVLPTLRRSRPNVTLTLAGNGSDALTVELASPDVTGTGFVEDPSPHFSRCTLAIAPLFEGAGIKFKVLEALAAGVPVLGTPVALEGIDPQSGLTCCAPQDFAQAVLNFLGADRTRE